MKCPKCGHYLENTYLLRFKYCKIKKILEKYGPSNDRKARWEELPDSGCGTLFEVPLTENELIESWRRKYN